MTDHDPLCLAAPVDRALSDVRQPCICSRLAQARIAANNQAGDAAVTGYDRGYVAGQRDERSAILSEDGWMTCRQVRLAVEDAEQDERDRVRRFILGLTTTPQTSHIVDTILWHINKGEKE